MLLCSLFWELILPPTRPTPPPVNSPHVYKARWQSLGNIQVKSTLQNLNKPYCLTKQPEHQKEDEARIKIGLTFQTQLKHNCHQRPQEGRRANQRFIQVLLRNGGGGVKTASVKFTSISWEVMTLKSSKHKALFRQILHIIQARGGAAGCSRQRQEVTN